LSPTLTLPPVRSISPSPVLPVFSMLVILVDSTRFQVGLCPFRLVRMCTFRPVELSPNRPGGASLAGLALGGLDRTGQRRAAGDCATGGCAAAEGATGWGTAGCTALSLPSVPCNVDFSRCVTLEERR
jgi:hypothetical protein